MNYSTLMVHLELDEANDARLQVAGDLAERFGAKLIGIVACDHAVPPYYADSAFSENLLEKDRAELRRRMADTEKHFRSCFAGRGLELEWRSALTAPTEYVARECRAADLIIAGPKHDAGLLDPHSRLDPSDLVMQAGRPVLLIPQKADWLRLQHVMVAWKDTREARRAVWDALPMLRFARDVTVAEAMEGEHSKDAQSRTKDVASWLNRHGVAARAMAPPAGDDVAEQLDLLVSDIGADLIVAGAYGHARLREWIFGGVTRDLLTTGRRPVVLSR